MTADISPNGAPLLELRDVEASYGPFRSLFGVSFAVRERSVMALLGANGSGKTTVVRVCCGLLKPTSGALFYQGRDITGIARLQAGAASASCTRPRVGRCSRR